MNQPPKRAYTFGEFSLDIPEKLLRRSGQTVTLAPKVFDTLVLLVENAGHLVGKDEFMERLWPGTFVGEDALARNISILRKVLDGTGDSQSLIATVPTRGYRFVGFAKGPLVSEGGELRAGLAYEQSAGAEAQDARRIASLAVLPFENLSQAPDQDYFAEGITDEIITRLADIHELRVISRTSSMQYKRTQKSAVQVGRELDVEGLLTGSLERSGRRLRMRVQLIHAPTDCVCWAQTYDRKLTDILSLESELAHDVTEQVKARVAHERSPERSQRSLNLAALEHYLRGRHFYYRCDEESLHKSMKHLGAAIEIEPAYAPARAALASSCFYFAYISGKYSEFSPRARSAAESALQIDPNLCEAHAALGVVAAQQYNLREAEREFQRAISLGPNDAAAHYWYGAMYLAHVGRLEDANHEMEQARVLDPASWTIGLGCAGILACQGRYDEARRELDKVIEIAPGYTHAYLWRILVSLLQEKRLEAAGDIERLKQLAKTDRNLALLGYILGVAGQRSDALAVLSRLKNQETHASAWWLAMVHLGLGERDEALAWLEKAYDERCAELIALNSMPVYDPIRKDPRFCALASRVGLPPQWRL